MPSLLIYSILTWVNVGNDHNFFSIEGFFPTETQMDLENFVIINPKTFKIYEDEIYILDQGEHGLHVLDLKGKFIRFIGGEGVGPGELSFPHEFVIIKDKIILIDSSRHIHYFSLEGEFLYRYRTLELVYSMVDSGDNLFISTISPSSDYQFAILDWQGKKINSINDQMRSIDGNTKNDDKLNLKIHADKIYGLQNYGLSFRIYSRSGNLLAKGKSQISPHDDEGIKNTGFFYTFMAFDVYNNHFVAAVPDTQALQFFVFNFQGILHHRVRIPLHHKDVPNAPVPVNQMAFKREGEIDYMYILIGYPTFKIAKIRFTSKLFSLEN